MLLKRQRRLGASLHPKAEIVRKQLRRRTLRTISVGIINHSGAIENDTPVLKDNELLKSSASTHAELSSSDLSEEEEARLRQA
jgi:hypothetical protein